MNKLRILALLSALLLAAHGLVALAAPDSEIYSELGQNLVEIRGGTLDGDDSTDVSSPISTSGSSLSVFKTRGDPTIAISARTSVNSAQVGIEVHLWRQDPRTKVYSYMAVAGIGTATGGRTIDSNGEYVAPTLYFDSAGATHYELRQTDPTVGTARYFTWTYGATTQRAQ